MKSDEMNTDWPLIAVRDYTQLHAWATSLGPKISVKKFDKNDDKAFMVFKKSNRQGKDDIKEVWVCPHVKNYLKYWRQAEKLSSGSLFSSKYYGNQLLDIDHLYAKERAIKDGFKFVRLHPIGRSPNRSAGAGIEKKCVSGGGGDIEIFDHSDTCHDNSIYEKLVKKYGKNFQAELNQSADCAYCNFMSGGVHIGKVLNIKFRGGGDIVQNNKEMIWKSFYEDPDEIKSLFKELSLIWW